uniref:Uncharacterized protein n=1 Tax=Anguilla anguilla TaxID=7936 RepID=A0A0E9VVE4_ANGAN
MTAGMKVPPCPCHSNARYLYSSSFHKNIRTTTGLCRKEYASSLTRLFNKYRNFYLFFKRFFFLL